MVLGVKRAVKKESMIPSGLYVKKLLVRIRLNGKNEQTHIPQNREVMRLNKISTLPIQLLGSISQTKVPADY